MMPRDSKYSVRCFFSFGSPKRFGRILIKGLALAEILFIKDSGQGPLRTTGCLIMINNAPPGEDNKEMILVKVINKK